MPSVVNGEIISKRIIVASTICESEDDQMVYEISPTSSKVLLKEVNHKVPTCFFKLALITKIPCNASSQIIRMIFSSHIF